MGKFKPGHIKKGGRTKGTPNKKTAEDRAFIRSVLSAFSPEDVQEDLQSMLPRDRVSALLTLYEFILPKLQRTTLAGDSETGSGITIQIIDKGTNQK